MNDDKLTLEKLKLNERMTSIESYVIDGLKMRSEFKDTLTEVSLRLKNVELQIHGDSTGSSKYVRDGINRRVDYLEQINHTGEEIKKNFFKVAVGSITLAIGGALVWIFDVVRQAFIKSH